MIGDYSEECETKECKVKNLCKQEAERRNGNNFLSKR
jgi:hypothetical protein